MIRDFNFQVWDKEKYNEYIEYLISLRDEKLEKFNKKIIPTKYKILGIKIPILKKIAKKISSTDIQTFFDNSLMIYFEEVMILGFVIGNLKKEETFLKYFYKFLFYIDNWAICDSFVSNLKIFKKIVFFDKTLNLILSNIEFTRRVGIVILLNYYIDDEHIDICLNAIKDLNDDSFYVNMAISWLISLSFIRFRSKTLTLLKSKALPVFVQNKAISKIRDSYRVTGKDKELVKNLRL